MSKIDQELSEIWKRTGELEGGLFADISLTYLRGDYFARKDYYTVKDGLVYVINPDNSLYATGDSLNSMKHCHRVGMYDPEKKYKSGVCKTHSYAAFKKLLGL